MTLVKQIGVLVIIGGVAAAAYFGWQQMIPDQSAQSKGQKNGKVQVVEVEAAPAAMRRIDTIVEAVGTTRAVRSVNISPLSSGRVVEVGFQDGEKVEKGSVLLRLNSEIQRADLAEAEATLKEAKSALKRSTILKRSSAVSEAALDRLVAQADIAKATRDRAAKLLRDRVIRAPFAGLIGFSSIEPGARVNEDNVIAILDDLSAVEVEFSVPEGLFGKLKIGDEVQARATPFPERIFTGTIAAIDTRIDNISRSFKVRGIIANEDQALPAGMFVHVSIVLDGSNALAIPEEAVVVDGSRAFVFALSSTEDPKVQRVDRRLISTGRRSFGYVEITEGLKSGEAVVIRGVQKVRDGSLVRMEKTS